MLILQRSTSFTIWRSLRASYRPALRFSLLAGSVLPESCGSSARSLAPVPVDPETVAARWLEIRGAE